MKTRYINRQIYTWDIVEDIYGGKHGEYTYKGIHILRDIYTERYTHGWTYTQDIVEDIYGGIYI